MTKIIYNDKGQWCLAENWPEEPRKKFLRNNSLSASMDEIYRAELKTYEDTKAVAIASAIPFQESDQGKVKRKIYFSGDYFPEPDLTESEKGLAEWTPPKNSVYDPGELRWDIKEQFKPVLLDEPKKDKVDESANPAPLKDWQMKEMLKLSKEQLVVEIFKMHDRAERNYEAGERARKALRYLMDYDPTKHLFEQRSKEAYLMTYESFSPSESAPSKNEASFAEQSMEKIWNEKEPNVTQESIDAIPAAEKNQLWNFISTSEAKDFLRWYWKRYFAMRDEALEIDIYRNVEAFRNFLPDGTPRPIVNSKGEIPPIGYNDQVSEYMPRETKGDDKVNE